MTEEEFLSAVREMRVIIDLLKTIKPQEVEQHIFAQNFGLAGAAAMGIRSTVLTCQRHLVAIEKSIPDAD